MKVLVGIYTFFLGSVFASFFGVIIDRTPRGISVVSPASKCDYCGHSLKWYENIPIFSYLFLKGKCSNCKTKISSFLFILEIIGGLSLLFVYLKYGLTIECLLICLICLMMLLIGGYDYKTNYVLNVFLIITAILSVCLFLYRVFVIKDYYLDYIFSLLIGLVFFISVRLIMSKILKTEALGTGDIYLAAIMGLCFKPFEYLLGITFGSLFGSILNLILIKLNKKNRSEEIAFCPYLCFGFYIVFIFGDFLSKLLVR